MGRAKEIIVKVIPSKIANQFVKKWHYSGKVAANSQLHFGAFLDGSLHGVMSYGPSLDKRKIQILVKDTGWNEFLELNRMAFDDYLPKNSESRCISISIKLLKKNAPHIKWIVSFSDGAQCGDGTIYRASGFLLTGIKKNDQMWKAPNGEVFSRASLTGPKAKIEQKKALQICDKLGAKGANMRDTGKASMEIYKNAGFKPIPGYQIRYIYFIDKSKKQDLNVPILPFSTIDKMGAGMYKGEKIPISERNKSA